MQSTELTATIVPYVPPAAKGTPTEVAVSSSTQVSAVSVIAKKWICDQCEKEASKAFICNRCKKAQYCSKDCQTAAWKTHQKVCRDANLIPNDDVIVCKLKEDGVRDITQAEFKKMMGATYVCNNLYSDKLLKTLNRKSNNNAIQKIHQVSDAIAIQHHGDSMGYGLIALKKIKKGESLCTVGGDAFLESVWDDRRRPERQRIYSLRAEDFVFDASSYRGLGALANDGLPNAEFSTSDIYIGEPNEIFELGIAAIRDIEAGEIITVDYGEGHWVKDGHYVMDQANLDRLIKNHSKGIDFSLIDEKTITLSARDAVRFNLCAPVTQIKEIQYICNTFYAMAYLHLNSNLDPLETLKAIEKLSEGQRQALSPQSKALLFQSNILKGLAKIPKKDKAEFSNILGKVSQLSLFMICKALSSVTPTPSAQECEKFGKVLDKLHLLFHGSWNANYAKWTESEKNEMKAKFMTLDYLREVFQNPPSISHPGLLIQFKHLREGSWDNFLYILTPEEQRKLRLLREQVHQS